MQCISQDFVLPMTRDDAVDFSLIKWWNQTSLSWVTRIEWWSEDWSKYNFTINLSRLNLLRTSLKQEVFCNTKMKWHILIRATNWAFHKSFFSTNAREVWQFEDKKDEQWFSAWLKTWSFLLHSCTLSEKSIFSFPNDYDDIIIIISQWVVGDKILPLSCNWIFSTFQIFPLDHMTWNNFCDDNDDDFFLPFLIV